MNEALPDTHQAQANEQNLRLLINNIDDPIWLVDADLRIVECNDAFKKWVCFFIGRELDKGDHVLYEGQDRSYFEKFEMCYNLALSGRSFRSVEDMYVNGALRYTSVKFNPVFDDQHSVQGVCCAASDITEHRKHLLKIEEQNTVLREIAFIESHRVRGPVANILGLEQFFNYDNPGDDFNAEIMRNIFTMGHQLDEIIHEVVRKSNEIGLQP